MTEALIRPDAKRELTLAEEFALFGEEDVVEMVNLYEQDTGMAGVVFVSTRMGPHGPRVKYFVKAVSDDLLSVDRRRASRAGE